MPYPAQLLTQQVVTPDLVGFCPDVRHLPRHEIHFDAELWDSEVMQYVVRAEQEGDRFVYSSDAVPDRK